MLKTHVDRIQPILEKKQFKVVNAQNMALCCYNQSSFEGGQAWGQGGHRDWVVRTGHREHLRGKRRDAGNNFLGKVFSTELKSHSPDSEYL